MEILTLSIAGYKILLKWDDSEPIIFDEAYKAFEINNPSGEYDVEIRVITPFIPMVLQVKYPLLFEAADANQKYFSVFLLEDCYKFEVYKPLSKELIQQVAFLRNDLEEWNIYTYSLHRGDPIYPLEYPMGPLIFYYLTVKYPAAMMHASGVFDGEKGRLFTGFSGSGKSTMSSLWQNAGSKVVNDDRLIIRKEGGQYFMYNTPMIYVDAPKKEPLDAIYIIEHSSENRLEKLSGAAAVTAVMAFCIQHSYNPEFIVHHLDFVSELCAELPVYRLGFKSDASVVDFIKEHGF